MKKFLSNFYKFIYEVTGWLHRVIKKFDNNSINEALQPHNWVQKKEEIADFLEKESQLVRDESLKVLSEFESLESD